MRSLKLKVAFLDGLLDKVYAKEEEAFGTRETNLGYKINQQLQAHQHRSSLSLMLMDYRRIKKKSQEPWVHRASF